MSGQNSGVETDVMVAIDPTAFGFGESSASALAESGELAAEKFVEIIKGMTETQKVSAVLGMMKGAFFKISQNSFIGAPLAIADMSAKISVLSEAVSTGQVKSSQILGIAGGVIGLIQSFALLAAFDIGLVGAGAAAGAALAGTAAFAGSLALALVGVGFVLDYWSDISGFVDDALQSATNLVDKFFDYVSSSVSTPTISSITNTDFLAAISFVRRVDPLALDLDQDGIETVAASSGIVFDFNGDGVKTGTGWVSADDGFLVLDRNNNGIIDDGGELFGVDTVKKDGSRALSGFDALSDLDSNGDGIFDAMDAQFGDVKIWRDLNQDGVSQAGELSTLAEMKISAINLMSSVASQASNGNQVSGIGTFVFEDGGISVVSDNESIAANLDLASNPFYRDFTDQVELSDEIAALPDMQGAGAVRDLQESMTLDSRLLQVVSLYAELNTRDEQLAFLDELLSAWANTASFTDLTSRIENLSVDGHSFEFAPTWEVRGGDVSSISPEQLAKQSLLEKIRVLEIFNAQTFFDVSVTSVSTDGSVTVQIKSGSSVVVKNYDASRVSSGLVLTENDLIVSDEQAVLINKAYQELELSVFAGLSRQTILKPYLELVSLHYLNGGFVYDYSAVESSLMTEFEDSPVETVLNALELQKYLGDENLNSKISYWVGKLSGGELISLKAYISAHGVAGFTGVDLEFGGALVDLITAGPQTGFLFGGDGNDVLTANVHAADSVLAGGTGDDTLYGSYYSDTYVFNLGDGQDQIYEYDPGYGASDTLRFGEGIVASDIQLLKAGSDLVFKHLNGTDQITLKGVFDSTASNASVVSTVVIEQVVFADGTTWLWSDIVKRGLEQTGTDAGETMIGWTGNDIIHGGGGDDVLDAGGGTNQLSGDAGDDILQVDSNSKDNVLAGGTGNDKLYGGYYADTYLFDRGDGQDQIIETDGGYGAVDTLSLGNGLSPEDMWFRQVGNDLELSVVGTSDSMTIKNWYSGSGYQIENIKAGGLTLVDSQVQNLVDKMASFGVSAGSETALSQSQHAELDMVLAASWK